MNRNVKREVDGTMQAQHGLRWTLPVVVAATLLGTPTVRAVGATLSLVQDGKPVYAVVVPDGNDAVMTSSAVVGEMAYVVDQMGTAYCIDASNGQIIWKTAPDAAGAMGANTSSPCVAQGRLYFGTTAGSFHILDARDGQVIKTVNVGSPILSAPTFANGRVFWTSAGNGVIYCWEPR
jgi:outer membrane protein assembly factor BamB